MDIKSIILLTGIVGSLITVYVINRKIQEKDVLNSPLTIKEKVIIWLLCLLMPVISGAIFYYGLKNKIKAKQANRISFIAFFIMLLIYVLIINYAPH